MKFAQYKLVVAPSDCVQTRRGNHDIRTVINCVVPTWSCCCKRRSHALAQFLARIVNATATLRDTEHIGPALLEERQDLIGRSRLGPKQQRLGSKPKHRCVHSSGAGLFRKLLIYSFECAAIDGCKFGSEPARARQQ